MDEKRATQGSGIGDQGLGIRLMKPTLLLAIILWLALGSLAPAFADGPLLPGSIIRDGEPVPAPAGYVQAGVISGEGRECGPFAVPKDLLLDPATGNLLVVDTGNNRVVILSGSGEYLSEIGGEEDRPPWIEKVRDRP